ncbi:uncharacterized protein LOC100367786 [Saccoglossus kowalevskii]|uniref:Tax1-binding protein 1 homolog n=1 Tax=Saccoglossus kowalevskii TaxID=10224 RepID=A0ABM0GZ48_SACKO|nr:PREDICTED: tax1-binding protein 1 homolog [Saccoglossus kowalevskii]
MSLRMPESINNNNAPAANPFENMFINPYVDEARELGRQHEVVTRGIHYNMHSPRSIPPPIPPPRPCPGYVMPMVPPTTPDLLPECFGAAATSAPLLPPMRPTVLPQAKLAAVKNETRTAADAADQSDSDVYDEPDAVTPQETVTIQVDGHVPEERDDVATEFHDAQEFSADRAARWCPECNFLFPPSCPSDTFEQHVQSHFRRVCPMCRKQFPKDSCDQDAFEDHVQTHFERE